MKRTSWQPLRAALDILSTVALLGACVEGAPIGPDLRQTGPAEGADAAAEITHSGASVRAVALDGCEILEVPAGSRLAVKLFAAGVQIYRWNGTSWSFVEPAAELYADAGFHGVIGTHFAGPTWLSNGGSRVVGAVLQRCARDADAIPWLLLQTVSTDGPGVFQKITYIQRVNTTDGLAPSFPGSETGELARVPYTAEYLFFRAR